MKNTSKLILAALAAVLPLGASALANDDSDLRIVTQQYGNGPSISYYVHKAPTTVALYTHGSTAVAPAASRSVRLDKGQTSHGQFQPIYVNQGGIR